MVLAFLSLAVIVDVLPLFPFQVDGGVVVVDGVEVRAEDVGHFHAHGRRVHTGVAAEPLGVEHIFVDDQSDVVLGVVHEPHDTDRAGLDVEVFLHELGVRERQACDAQLTGDLLRLELFIVLDHQEVKLRLLSVAQKQVLADDRRCQDLVDLRAHFHRRCRLRVDTVVLYTESV